MFKPLEAQHLNMDLRINAANAALAYANTLADPNATDEDIEYSHGILAECCDALREAQESKD